MPAGGGKRGAPPAAGGAAIDVLPDEVLQHILGFLEAQESVRTCVLARRWRHLWKSAMVLRIIACEGKFLGSVEKLCNFLDRLLLHLRGGSPLHTCELWFTYLGRNMLPPSYQHEDRLARLVNTWFWYAVRCQVRVVRLHAYIYSACYNKHSLVLDNTQVNSQHLTRLELGGVVVDSKFLDFTNCPSLDHLEFRSCCFDCDYSRLHIYAPNLGSLSLVKIWGMIPMLQNMPSLVKAHVMTGDESWDTCDMDNCNCEFCDNLYGIGVGTGSNGCVLLKGLSEAKDLTLISGHKMFIFKKDLRWCPIFNNLKTLFLNDYWCVPDDYRALVCILEHSPVLEKLTLAFSHEKHRQERERGGSLRPMMGSAAILEHLKIIEVKCSAVDERIHKITLFLCAFRIRLIFC